MLPPVADTATGGAIRSGGAHRRSEEFGAAGQLLDLLLHDALDDRGEVLVEPALEHGGEEVAQELLDRDLGERAGDAALLGLGRAGEAGEGLGAGAGGVRGDERVLGVVRHGRAPGWRVL